MRTLNQSFQWAEVWARERRAGGLETPGVWDVFSLAEECDGHVVEIKFIFWCHHAEVEAPLTS